MRLQDDDDDDDYCVCNGHSKRDWYHGNDDTGKRTFGATTF